MATVSFQVRRRFRARHIRMRVERDGVVVVTAPLTVSTRVIERLIDEKHDWIRAQVERMSRVEHNPLLRHSREDYLAYREQARGLVHERLAHFNASYGFTYADVRIKQHKSRWGSCSKKGNLNFNYKIALLPPHLADYIIVHELCHLGELNHGPRFWALVARAVPEYKAARRELRLLSQGGASA